jgi:predicted adenylyl cyclase CyaB
MTEIEVKILEVDPEALARKLDELGAEKASEAELETLFFDYPNGSLGKGRNLLRLRRSGELSWLTYKGYLADPGAKVREEWEVKVSDFGLARKILEALGLQARLRILKHRLTYRLERATLAIDRHQEEFARIPPLLEIEAPSVEEVRAVARLLGFSPEQCLAWDFAQLLAHYPEARR